MRPGLIATWKHSVLGTYDFMNASDSKLLRFFLNHYKVGVFVNDSAQYLNRRSSTPGLLNDRFQTLGAPWNPTLELHA